MKRKRRLHLILSLCLSALVSPRANGLGDEPPGVEPSRDFQPSKFLRLMEGQEGLEKLQSAIVTYKRKDGVKVHLVAVLHIAEKTYYEGLSRTFEDYDALLYEMVKGKNDPVQGVARSESILSLFQRWLKNTLDLEFQLDAIDYTKENFIHADMDVETFQKLQNERGESIFTLMLKVLQQELARQSHGEDVQQITIVDLIRILTSRDRSLELKKLLARNFEDIETRVAGIEGENGSVILTERNKVALKVLAKTLKEGKKNVGIFYGAAHMADMEERLVRKLGFEKVREEWRVAWDLVSRKQVEDTGGPGKSRGERTPNGEKPPSPR